MATPACRHRPVGACRFKLANARCGPIWIDNVRQPLVALHPEYHSITYNSINTIYATLLK